MPFSLIDALQHHRADVDLSKLSSPAEVLACLDPRRLPGRRYRLGLLLASCLLAVPNRATTLADMSDVLPAAV